MVIDIAGEVSVCSVHSTNTRKQIRCFRRHCPPPNNSESPQNLGEEEVLQRARKKAPASVIPPGDFSLRYRPTIAKAIELVRCFGPFLEPVAWSPVLEYFSIEKRGGITLNCILCFCKYSTKSAVFVCLFMSVIGLLSTNMARVFFKFRFLSREMKKKNLFSGSKPRQFYCFPQDSWIFFFICPYRSKQKKIARFECVLIEIFKVLG